MRILIQINPPRILKPRYHNCSAPSARFGEDSLCSCHNQLTHWPLGDLYAIMNIFNLALLFHIFRSSYSDNALRWMSRDLTEDKSTLVQVMAWCRQAPSHYLSQCWPRSMSLHGVTRPQWVNLHKTVVTSSSSHALPLLRHELHPRDPQNWFVETVAHSYDSNVTWPQLVVTCLNLAMTAGSLRRHTYPTRHVPGRNQLTETDWHIHASVN